MAKKSYILKTYYPNFSGRYVPVAIPDDDGKKSRKLAKKLTCTRCGKRPAPASLFFALIKSSQKISSPLLAKYEGRKRE